MTSREFSHFTFSLPSDCEPLSKIESKKEESSPVLEQKKKEKDSRDYRDALSKYAVGSEEE